MITIKTFSNGHELTCEPSLHGYCDLRVNGRPAFLDHCLTPRKHPVTGEMIVAVVTAGGAKYGLFRADVDALQASSQHYIKTIDDHVQDLISLSEVVTNAQRGIGDARRAATNRMHKTSVWTWTDADALAEANEKKLLDEAIAAFEAAKAATPDAWTKLQSDRADAIARAMND